MVLTGVKGLEKEITRILKAHSITNKSTILLNCTNNSNIEQYQNIYTINLRTSNKFNETLKELPKLAKALKTKNIIIIPNKKSSQKQTWELLYKISKDHHILIHLEKGSYNLAQTYCDSIKTGGDIMRHTITGQKIAAEVMVNELRGYAKALQPKERNKYEQMLKQPLKHIGSLGCASSNHVWALLLLSTVFEQEKKIQYLEDQYEALSYRMLEEREIRRAQEN